MTAPLNLDPDTTYAWTTWRGMPGYSPEHDPDTWDATPREAADYVRDECRRILEEDAETDDEPGVATGYATVNDLRAIRILDHSDLDHVTGALEDILTTGTYRFLLVSGNRGYGFVVGVSLAETR